jgi:hypothetical protein
MSINRTNAAALFLAADEERILDHMAEAQQDELYAKSNEVDEAIDALVDAITVKQEAQDLVSRLLDEYASLVEAIEADEFDPEIPGEDDDYWEDGLAAYYRSQH